MKLEGSEGFIALVLIAALALGGCASTVTRPDGTKIPASVYAYELAIDARKEDSKTAAANANMAATCDDAVKAGTPTTPLSDIGQAVEALRTIGGLAVCGQRVAKSDTTVSTPTPQYIAPPTMLDRVVQLAPLALGVGQLVASDRANARQTDASVLIAGIGAQRELGIVQAATGSNERISTGGFSAISQVAGAGLGALGDAAQSASAASVANSQAWAGALTSLPPTTQIIAGRDVIQARDVDQSTTAGDRVNGNGNRLRNVVDCGARGGDANASAGGLSANTAPITTSPSVTSPLNATYNPLVSATTAPVSNDCGNG